MIVSVIVEKCGCGLSVELDRLSVVCCIGRTSAEVGTIVSVALERVQRRHRHVLNVHCSA